ncbi:hypothetical protein DL764_007448 [Monosporascus ibericus]|uniref:Uncharacterized protein n=1 Tax=Monosporascus ibericus TaxID=155417 RepID=A0A4V1X9M0_9PEZI|nr:hypothetical protein DL764_007448 [Monosporascus ibericus]
MAPNSSSNHIYTLGVQPIHRACLEGNLEEVIRLVDTHQNIDLPLRPPIQQPGDEPTWPSGETPLMLAALMGHIKIFESLVRSGAAYDKGDDEGFHVQSYSSEKAFAMEKRTLFLKNGIGREHAKGPHAREAITDLLDHPARLQVLISGIGDSGYPNVLLGKEGKKIKLFACVGSFNTGEVLGMEKTIGGVMVGGSHSVLKFAVSGFKGRSIQHDPKVLERKFWNKIALTKVARIINFRFHGNLHDNGARRPLPHHIGRVQAGHVEVQLATYYVIEMGNRNAQRKPGGEAWSTMRKLRALRSAHLGEERHAALSNYTRITFSIQGDAAIGPIIRTKTGRGRMAVDEVMHTFSDPDAQPDPSDDEADEDEMDSMVVRPVVTEAVLTREESRNHGGADRPQSQVIVLDDTIEEEEEGEEEGAAWDSDDTDCTMPFTAPPSSLVVDQGGFSQRLQRFAYVPNAAPPRKQREPRRPRTYEERMRYRNPRPTPIWSPPDYLASSSFFSERPLPRPQTRQRPLPPVPRHRDQEPTARPTRGEEIPAWAHAAYRYAGFLP